MVTNWAYALRRATSSLKICFISADEGTNEMLEVLRKLITNKKDSLEQIEENIEVFSFKSYEEMDRFSDSIIIQ